MFRGMRCRYPVRTSLLALALASCGGPPAVQIRELHDPVGTARFDHSSFDALLREQVTAEGGFVNYKALRTDSSTLDAYIESLATAPFGDMGRDEKLAFLLNAYNAFTLRLIVENKGVDSITDIPASRRWKAQRWKLAGKIVSLNDIEHRMVRPAFAEPRIHFALVCAAIGCPPLRAEAYTADKLELQLAEQTHYVHTHPRWLVHSLGSGKIGLTQLYKWYGGDFVQVAGSILEFVAAARPDLAESLGPTDGSNPPAISWLDYDWSLNSLENRR